MIFFSQTKFEIPFIEPKVDIFILDYAHKTFDFSTLRQNFPTTFLRHFYDNQGESRDHKYAHHTHLICNK